MTETTPAPPPHYCAVTPRQDGSREGCPDWPLCVFTPPRTGDGIAAPRRPVVLDTSVVEPATATEVGPKIGEGLAALMGFAAAAVLLLAVVAILLPVFL